MRSPREFSVWQSVSDLAMGLMAVVLLLLILLLVQQGKEKAEAERDKLAAEQQKRDVEKERAVFAADVLKLLVDANRLVRSQDSAETAVQNLFQLKGCKLRLDNDGRLKTIDNGPVDRFPDGRYRLSEMGRENIRKCAQSFEWLSRFLSSEELASVIDSYPSEAKPGLDEVTVLRSGLEALVVQGNTDKANFTSDSSVPEVLDPSSSRDIKFSKLDETYIRNHFLGAERARQAVGNLFDILRQDALLESFRNVLRVESASFSRYKEFTCIDSERCDDAKNISLRIQWHKESLRKPFTEFKSNLCDSLSNKDSALYKGLVDDSKRKEILSNLIADKKLGACLGLSSDTARIVPEQIAKCLECQPVLQSPPDKQNP